MPRTPPSNTSNSSSLVSGRPVTAATPSPMLATRPIWSSRGASAASAIRSRVRARRDCSASVSVGIGLDPLADCLECAATGKPQDRIRKVQFGAGNEPRIDAVFDRDAVAEGSAQARPPILGAFCPAAPPRSRPAAETSGRAAARGQPSPVPAECRHGSRCARSRPRLEVSPAIRRTIAGRCPRRGRRPAAALPRAAARAPRRLILRAPSISAAASCSATARRRAACSSASTAACVIAAERSAAMPARSFSIAASRVSAASSAACAAAYCFSIRCAAHRSAASTGW